MIKITSHTLGHLLAVGIIALFIYLQLTYVEDTCIANCNDKYGSIYDGGSSTGHLIWLVITGIASLVYVVVVTFGLMAGDLSFPTIKIKIPGLKFNKKRQKEELFQQIFEASTTEEIDLINKKLDSLFNNK